MRIGDPISVHMARRRHTVNKVTDVYAAQITHIADDMSIGAVYWHRVNQQWREVSGIFCRATDKSIWWEPAG